MPSGLLVAEYVPHSLSAKLDSPDLEETRGARWLHRHALDDLHVEGTAWYTKGVNSTSKGNTPLASRPDRMALSRAYGVEGGAT